MQLNDKVMLNPQVDRFEFSRGSVSYGEIGELVEIYNDEVRVNFPSCYRWHGRINELVLAQEYEGKKICRDCGAIIEDDNYEMYEGEYVCLDCLEDNYIVCEDCQQLVDRDRAYMINDGRGDYYNVCGDCYYSGDYHTCYDCGDIFYADDMDYHHGDYYCNDCYDRNGGDLYDYNGGDLYDYHEFQDWQLFDNGESPKYYIGKEIELEPKEDSNTKGVLEAIENNINAVGMHDGSLKNGGVEVVTHPESWEYLQEHKQDYVNFFNKMEELHYGNGGGCGLHFHVSRPNDNVTSRVIVLLESFREEIFKLSRRSEGQMHWCQFLTSRCNEKDKVKYHSTKWLKDKYIKEGHDRYYALNLCNRKTIEFRFFNGVNTFEQYWGALQFIHNIMEIALDEDRDINTINWQDLLVGEELREQARKRDVLNIDKFAKDTNEIIEKYEIALEKAKKDIANTLKNLAKYINNEMCSYDLKQEIKTNNIQEINNKVNDFMDKFKYRQQYLNRIINLYSCLTREGENIEMKDIKSYWDNTKISYPINSKRYQRYDKKITKAINEYESEVR